MKSENDITALLSEFQREGGDSFTYDGKAICAEYEKNHTQATPLAIQVLSIFGGLLGTLFLSVFFGLAGYLVMTFFGIVFIVATIGINRYYDKPLLNTSTVSFYVAGFCLLGFALFTRDISSITVCLVFIVISLITLFIVQNFMLSFLAVLIINGSIVFIMANNHFFDELYIYIAVLIAALNYLFFKEAKIITFDTKICRLYRPVRIGLLFSLIGVLILTIIQTKTSYETEWSPWGLLPSMAGIAAILYLISHIISLLNVEKDEYKWMIYLFILLLLSPTILFPALPVSLMIILLSFRFNYKTGFVTGIISFIYFAGQFYYDLNFTLLVKSILMIASGVLFLLFFLFTRHKLASK
jgi:hypothetical protein